MRTELSIPILRFFRRNGGSSFWEFDLDRSPFAKAVFSRNAPAVQFNDGPGDGKPQAGAAILPGWVSAPEVFKDGDGFLRTYWKVSNLILFYFGKGV